MNSLPNAAKFIELSDGRCHFEDQGATNGQVILMIHGGTVPAWIFDNITPMFVDEGFRVIRPDLYGHGYSARPRVTYSISLYVRQMEQFLAHLAPNKKIYVIGHSLGAAIATALSVRNKDRIRGVVLSAPLVIFFTVMPFFWALRIPWFGGLLMHTIIMPLLKRRRRIRYQNICNGKFAGKFENQLLIEGFSHALLSMFRADALSDQSHHYHLLEKTNIPVMTIIGKEDNVVLAEQFNYLVKILNPDKVCTIGGAGHALTLTHSRQMVEQVSPFFAEVQELQNIPQAHDIKP